MMKTIALSLLALAAEAAAPVIKVVAERSPAPIVLNSRTTSNSRVRAFTVDLPRAGLYRLEFQCGREESATAFASGQGQVEIQITTQFGSDCFLSDWKLGSSSP